LETRKAYEYDSEKLTLIRTRLGMRSPTSPPNTNMPTTSAVMYVVAIYGDELGSIGVKIRLMTIRKATNVIRANKVNANDDYYEMALAA
jgi:hypothetical protein